MTRGGSTRRAGWGSTTQVRMEFAYDGGGLAKGGDVTLYYDGEQVGQGRVDATQTVPLLGRRDDRCGLRRRHARFGRHAHREIHRNDQLGSARPRRRHPRSPRRPRARNERRDVAAVDRSAKQRSDVAPRQRSHRARRESRSSRGPGDTRAAGARMMRRRESGRHVATPTSPAWSIGAGCQLRRSGERLL